VNAENYKHSHEERQTIPSINIHKEAHDSICTKAEDEPHFRTLPLQNSEEIDSHLKKLSQNEHNLKLFIEDINIYRNTVARSEYLEVIKQQTNQLRTRLIRNTVPSIKLACCNRQPSPESTVESIELVAKYIKRKLEKSMRWLRLNRQVTNLWFQRTPA